ncbi:phenylalanine--tRNA ligase subunit alpha [Candidatus Bathyarchaeota archaeon]|nr:MAG: phenylalanine--tRNA ligase subunit alpha [Candidatus Bathyarchaeota archaeon]
MVRPLNPEDVAPRLHENERKVLLALKGRDTATTQELSSATGLGQDAVEKACAWAETKGVVSFREEVSCSFDLTDEGRTYAEDGLPERRLRDMLVQGPMEISNLKESFPLLNIALVWIRRNDWATIRDGTIELTQKGLDLGEALVERVISNLSQSPLDDSQLDETCRNAASLLMRRGLVEKTDAVERWVDLTEFGRDVIPFVEAVPGRRVITQLTPELLQNGGWKGATFQRYDVNLPVPSVKPGKRHFLSQVIEYIRRFWVELGFKEMKGEHVELSFWNFDALFQPQDHPARDLADTFYMKTPYKGRLPDPEMVRRVKETHENGWTTGSTGWEYKWDPEVAARNCLRTHGTSMSVHQISKLTPDDLPAKFFSVGRVFRNETIDWNHLAEFYHTDGIVIGEGVTFRDMQGYLKAYLEGLGAKRFRFRPGYFPYTEMSMEAEVWIEERGEWMELFGAGMFRPEVVKPLIGVDVPVLAWGPGFERLVMLSYRIDRIRQLYSNDLGLLRKARLWME